MAIKKYKVTVIVEVDEKSIKYVVPSIIDGMDFEDGESIIYTNVEEVK